jgi:hypothetical protein
LSKLSKPIETRSRSWVVAGLLAILVAPGCAFRRPTLSRSHEAALGLGGVGHMLTGSENPDDGPRYGAGAAVAWKASYAHCLDKGESTLCFEIPVDGFPMTKIASANPTAPRSYSTLALTPGVRLESNGLPGGFLPINFIAIGLGAARYVSSGTLLDGTTAERQRATMIAVRVDLGLKVDVGQRLGLRFGVFGTGGGEQEWFQRLGVLHAGESVSGNRGGGYGVVYIRR